MSLELLTKQKDIGKHNRKLVLSEIMFFGPIPRVKIAERTGLTQASVSRITRDLIDTNLVEECDEIENVTQRGRKLIALKIKSTEFFVAGISIHAFSQDVIIGDLTNAILISKQINLTYLDDAETVLKRATDVVNQLINEMGINRDRLIGCGVTVTGSIDPEQNIIRRAPIIGWSNVDVKKIIGTKLNTKIYMDNIPNAKNLATNRFGITKGINNVVVLNASIAIGCSLMVDGQLLRGKEFNTGLIDSLKVPLENSGKLVPIDSVAGGLNLIDMPINKMSANSVEAAKRLMQVIDNANRGDTKASAALHLAGRNLAFAVSVIKSIIHPDMFLLSGPLINSGAYCTGIRTRLTELEGIDFVKKQLRCSNISNQESTLSLAIYKSLAQGDLTTKIANI